jgi:hypothetical protein
MHRLEITGVLLQDSPPWWQNFIKYYKNEYPNIKIMNLHNSLTKYYTMSMVQLKYTVNHSVVYPFLMHYYSIMNIQYHGF